MLSAVFLYSSLAEHDGAGLVNFPKCCRNRNMARGGERPLKIHQLKKILHATLGKRMHMLCSCLPVVKGLWAKRNDLFVLHEKANSYTRSVYPITLSQTAPMIEPWLP